MLRTRIRPAPTKRTQAANQVLSADGREFHDRNSRLMAPARARQGRIRRGRLVGSFERARSPHVRRQVAL
jgi:hypothetical protein